VIDIQIYSIAYFGEFCKGCGKKYRESAHAQVMIFEKIINAVTLGKIKRRP
jgi:hypothetical protein